MQLLSEVNRNCVPMIKDVFWPCNTQNRNGLFLKKGNHISMLGHLTSDLNIRDRLSWLKSFCWIFFTTYFLLNSSFVKISTRKTLEKSGYFLTHESFLLRALIKKKTHLFSFLTSFFMREMGGENFFFFLSNFHFKSNLLFHLEKPSNTWTLFQ